MPREKSRYREKRSVSYSSDSSYERKRLKTKHKRRSRSKDRSESSYKRRRSRSRSRRRRSPSRDRTRRKSPKSKSKKYRRSSSRERSYSRSRSTSKSRNYSKRKGRRSRSSSSRSNSLENDISTKKTHIDEPKVTKSAEPQEDMPITIDQTLLEEINSECFVQKSFSSKNKKKQNIVIDLNSDKVTMPIVDAPKEDSLISFTDIPEEEELREMWIRKLYTFRKKMLKGDI